MSYIEDLEHQREQTLRAEMEIRMLLDAVDNLTVFGRPKEGSDNYKRAWDNLATLAARIRG